MKQLSKYMKGLARIRDGSTGKRDDGSIIRSMGSRDLIINGKELNLKAETWLIVCRHKSAKGKLGGFFYLLCDFPHHQIKFRRNNQKGFRKLQIEVKNRRVASASKAGLWLGRYATIILCRFEKSEYNLMDCH